MIIKHFNVKKTFALLFCVLIFGCQGGDNKTNIELIQDMMEGPQIKAQEGTADGKMLNRLPPVKSVSRNYNPYPFDKSDVRSAEGLVSPKNTLTKAELLEFNEFGKTKYEIYCGICHGNSGLGDGSIADKMLKSPPSLVTDVYKGYSDGRLFHVVTNGWGLMGGYGSQVPVEIERWAIVDYVRKLQGLSGKKSDKTAKTEEEK